MKVAYFKKELTVQQIEDNLKKEYEQKINKLQQKVDFYKEELKGSEVIDND